MRGNGNLTKWNDERGFGFITPDQGGADVFVHISAFPRDGRRPTLGERLSFEVETEASGRRRAKNLICPDRFDSSPRAPSRSQPRAMKRSPIFWSITAVMLLVLGAYGLSETGRRARREARWLEVEKGTAQRCDGRRYCSEMTSCTEAKFFLRNCPGVAMDGDKDGIPCEEQWCGGLFRN